MEIPDLDQTQNYEIDFGFEKRFDSGKIKLTTFYSMLKDYYTITVVKLVQLHLRIRLPKFFGSPLQVDFSWR